MACIYRVAYFFCGVSLHPATRRKSAVPWRLFARISSTAESRNPRSALWTLSASPYISLSTSPGCGPRRTSGQSRILSGTSLLPMAYLWSSPRPVIVWWCGFWTNPLTTPYSITAGLVAHPPLRVHPPVYILGPVDHEPRAWRGHVHRSILHGKVFVGHWCVVCDVGGVYHIIVAFPSQALQLLLRVAFLLRLLLHLCRDAHY